jgi:hypothetical protein
MDDDDFEGPRVLAVGEAATFEDEHASHTYLYVPDLSSATGWGAHRVPEPEPPPKPAPVGFRSILPVDDGYR